MLGSTVRHMEKSAGMVLAGLGMQVGERTSGVMVMNAVVRVRLAIWVGEIQLSGRRGGWIVKNATIQVRSTVWVEEKWREGGGVLGGGV